MSSRSHVSISDLLEVTKTVTDWYTFGVYLKMKIEVLKDIERKYSSEGLKRCKIELFGLWMKKYPNHSWTEISTALEKCDENEIAQQIRERYLQPLTLPDSDVNNPPTSEPTTLVCLEKDKVERFMELEIHYAQLTVNIKTALEEKQVPLLKLGRFLIGLLEEDDKLLQADTIDQFFQMISPYYCFINTAILKAIVVTFIGEPLNQQLKEYESQLEEVKESTSLALLKEIGPQCSPNTEAPRVTIKLAACWQKVTIKRFQKLVEHIFGEKSTTLTHIHVKEGCISVTWYTRISAVRSLVAQAHNKIDLLRSSDVLELIVSDVVVFEQEDINMPFAESTLLRIVKSAGVGVGEIYIAHKRVSHLEAVEFFLSNGANPNCSVRGMTPLMFACQHGLISFATKLLQAGANVNLQDYIGVTALGFACISESPNKDLVKLLLQSGADINARLKAGYLQGTILMLAVKSGNISIVQCLLDEGASVNTQDMRGETALTLASSSGHFEIVHLLLKYGADVNIVVQFGLTALTSACVLQHTACVDHLLASGADPNLCSRKLSPLMAACFVGDQTMDPTILEKLLSAGAKPNTVTEDGFTALMIAVAFVYEEGVDILLNAGADANIHTLSTGLHLGAAIGHLAICKKLLASGAQTTLRNDNGETPLDIALSMNHHDVYQLLQTHTKEVEIDQPLKQTTTTDPATTQESSKPVQDTSKESSRQNFLHKTKSPDIFSIFASLRWYLKDILQQDRAIKFHQDIETQEAASPILSQKN